MAYAETRRRLLEALPKGGEAAEIGVWKGDFSAAILNIVQPRKLHLIDPWQVSERPEHATAWYGAERGEDLEKVYQGVCERFSEETASGQVVMTRRPSEEALPLLPPAQLDFVYVDGDHSFDAVRSDLELAWPAIRRGGLLCIDDHQIAKWWGDGVVRATNGFLGRHQDTAELKYVADSQVVIRKR